MKPFNDSGKGKAVNMGDTINNEPAFVSFNLNSMASLYVAVAIAKTLPFMKDVSLEDRVLIDRKSVV